ncbi:related to transport protein USO1 [Cephalotrichum gorgonifer]|uniref:Related to transport protein USO1 n=1 Tax=Cephalotrichum gorgonifer TaxID=2041049 RepID=A0AAE8SYB4_9PEZI|nr:related to transport protein USO1 [Cephalotrichum gorgonifer]
MPPIERDGSLDSPKGLRHKHSASSDHGRALIIPMWDSSDPERAPPPLPLNPQSPSIGTSRPGTSAIIQSAHAAMTEKARENNLVVNPFLAKRLNDLPPERPLPIPRPSPHRRMQSLQPTSVRERGLMIEGIPSSPISPEKTARPSTPVRHRESVSIPAERDSQRMTPGPGPTFTPVVRPVVKRPHQQSILGENTPPQSATMLALHSMSSPPPKETEAPAAPVPALSNVTNNSTAAATKTSPTPDASELSQQIETLTNIATSLQKELSALSRRSRDNATDLMSLKQATNSRDEDIRKTLRDLMGNLSEKTLSGIDPFHSAHLDSKSQHSHTSPPPPSSARSGRPFSLPRIPSPNSFASSIDRDSVCTPSLSAADAPATIALLEKIIRDMGTREGQDLLITRLTEVAEKLAGMASATKVEELLQMVKQSHHEVTEGGRTSGGPRAHSRQVSFDEESIGTRGPSFDDHGSVRGLRSLEVQPRGQGSFQDSTLNPAASDLVNEDIIKIIRSVKDSVSQGGGLTAEVKALVRELRGEVLGMGRELRRRLDDVVAGDEESPRNDELKEEMTHVVNEGLDELKDHMDSLLQEHRRQSATSATSKASVVDYHEIYNAMRAALKDCQGDRSQQQKSPTRDDVIDAVREAWESYKPEIEVQQFGLERDEILACLKEGLQGHTSLDDHPVGATREEVFRAVVEGLKHFVPPQMEIPATLSRDEILEAVRECLEEFEFPVAPSALGNDLSRDDMVQAVKEGLHDFEFPESRALAIPQPSNDSVMSKLAEIIELMRLEFRSVSDEARQNVAANGRDTEQVLDATKDGFEKLREDMEKYVDRISGRSDRNQSLDHVIKTLDAFRDEISEVLETQIDSIRDSVNMSLVPAAPAQNNLPMKDALDGIREGLDRIRGELQRPLAGTTEILDTIQESMSDLHIRIEKLGNRPADLTANDEILNALKAGLDSVRSDIESIRESRDQNDRAIAPFGDKAIIPHGDEDGDEGRNGNDNALTHEDIKNLEVMITQLRIKIEAMDGGHSSEILCRDDISRMEDTLNSLKEAVDGIPRGNQPRAETDENGERSIDADSDLKEDLQAIETILRNTRSRIDDLMEGDQAVRKEHVDGLEAIMLETRDALSLITTQMDNTPRQSDFTKLESLVSHLVAAHDEMKERADKELDDPERVTRTDVEAVEAVCLDVKGLVNELAKTDMAVLPTKEELNEIVTDLKERIEGIKASTSKAVTERDAEAIDVNARITEVKDFLSEFQEVTRSRLEDGVVGIETVGKLLERMNEITENNSTVGDDLKEMLDTMKFEFEESRASIVGAKLDGDEKIQQTAATLASKIDERIDELVAKYDEFQAALDEKAEAGESREEATEAALMGTKAVAEELKLLIDTLGSTVTDSLEKMEEASKTVFDRVEDFTTRASENHTEDKAEHEQTREQVKQAIAAVESLHGPVSEIQPKVLEAVKELSEAITQHYDYSKAVTSDLQLKIEEAKPVPEKYDDSGVQEKLDKLVGHNETTDTALAQLDAALKEKFESIVANTGEKLDTLITGNQVLDAYIKDKVETLFVNSEATGEAVSRFDTFLKEKFENLAANTDEKLAGILVNTEATGEAFSQFDISVKEKIDGLVTSTGEKLESILVNTEATGEGFSQLDANIKDRLDKILGSTSTTGEAFSQLDGFLKEKLEKLMDHTDANGESVSQLDSDLKERLDKLSEQTMTAGKAFDQLDGSVGSVGGKLDQLIDHTHAAGNTFAQMDTAVQEKLDKLVGHSQSTERALEQLESLDRIHVQVIATAASISEFLANQTQRINNEHEDRERSLQETTIALERRNVEREHVEMSIAALREEEARLKSSVLGLQAENESLSKQKTKLAADVSSLETALRLRREELGEMEDRAEGLERRILEGVMNHSRVLLMSKNKGSETMNRKRVKVNPEGFAPEPRKPVVNMALSAKRSLGTPGGSPATGGSRRIVSLSQINNNVPAGVFTRSHSVKAPSGVGRGGMRKGSWTGTLKGYGELDKENVVDVKEEDEEADKENAGARGDEGAGGQLVVLKDREVLARSARSSGSTLNGDEESVDEFHDGRTDGGLTESEAASEVGTTRRDSRATDVSYSTGLGEYSDEDSDEYSGSESDVTESAVGTTLSGMSGMTVGNEVVLLK